MWIDANWQAPQGVRAVMSTRRGGISSPPYASLNLGLHVGDAAVSVQANRDRLQTALSVDRIQWLDQVHGDRVALVAADGGEELPAADAAVTAAPRVALAIMVADCLPVLFARGDASVVGAAHAGWRGLAAGVLGNTLSALGGPTADVRCWLGPCISPPRYEVDDFVRGHFSGDELLGFRATRPGHYAMDLQFIARVQLRALGVIQIAASNLCVHSAKDDFYSHRREQPTGRCAALIWRAAG